MANFYMCFAVFILAPMMRPLLYSSRRNLPKRDELSLRIVLAFPTDPVRKRVGSSQREISGCRLVGVAAPCGAFLKKTFPEPSLCSWKLSAAGCGGDPGGTGTCANCGCSVLAHEHPHLMTDFQFNTSK